MNKYVAKSRMLALSCGLAMAISSHAEVGGASVSVSVSSTMPGAGKIVTATWVAPQTRADGSPITNLAGYKMYWGQIYGVYDHSQSVGGASNTVASAFVTSGVWHFAVTALDSDGNESEYSAGVELSVP
jgi:hypothetical protein